MHKGPLGLPPEYQKYPEYFDALNINEGTDTKNVLIEHLLKKHKVKTVLDLTCGTGSQVLYLAKKGYKVIGSDFSPELIKMAINKAKKEKLAVKFIEADMRTLKAGTFDAAITISNAVGHLTKAGFAAAMKNINRNLKESGIYIFDILNLEVMTDKTVASLSFHTHKQLNDFQIHHVQCSTLDRTNHRLTSYDTCVVQNKADKPTSFTNKCSLQIYSAKELKDMLARNGFKTIAQYDIDGTPFLNKKSLSILTVAMKNDER